MTPQCRMAVNAAAGRTLTDAGIRAIDDRISASMRFLARQDPQRWAAMPQDQRVLAGATQAMQELQAQAARKARNGQLQLVRTAEVEQQVNVLRQEYGASRSNALVRHMDQTEAYIKGVKDDYLRRLTDLIDAASSTEGTGAGRRALMFLFDAQNPTMSRDLAREIFDGANGATGNRLAQQGARAWLDTIESMRQRFNAAGGDVGQLEYGYLPQPHDQGRVLAAGADDWAAQVLPMLNRRRYVRDDGSLQSDAEVLDLLRASWQTIATDGMNKQTPGQFQGTGALANRGSASREIHFRDADAYLEYMARFGAGSMYDGVIAHVSGMARNIALVERYGPNPAQQMRLQFDLAARADGRKVDNLPLTAGQSPQAYWRVISGESGIAASQSLAAVAQGVRNIETAGKLAGAVLSSITDMATYFVTTGYNKLSYWDSLRNIGRQFDSGTRDFLDMHGAIAESMISDLNRWAGDNVRQGWSGRLANSTMKLSLMNAWTDTLRRSFQMTMMGGLAKLSRTKWADLTEWDRSHLQRKGLTEADWDVVTQAAPTRFRNSDFLTPEAIYATGDPAAPQVVAKVLGLIRDESEYAVINPDLATRAWQSWGGQQRGTGVGELARSVMQFKSFPIAMLSRHWRRMMEAPPGLDGAPALGNRLAYGMALGVSLTALGAIAFQTKQLVQGKDPADMTSGKFWARAMAQGGGLGIVGDLFLTDPTENFGDSAANAIKNIAGPAIGSGSDVVLKLGLENIYQAAAGDETHLGAESLRVLRSHLPYVNLWYAKAAIDHMGMHALQENLSPGYLSRMKARARDEWGQGYWWEPGTGGPDRAPDLSTAAGQ
ncbi:hypothetical protein [Pigmentiphaga sp. CHJ604]|uniref:hypothetical protein n=1 Tax=Pigmentiphaga sp. CHJ604 TaxID=3081984 RepID=UPI0030CC6937